MKKLLFAALLALPVTASAQARFFVPGIRVTVAPPALRMEVAPAAPSPLHHWINGYWAWRGGRHLWVTGRWAIPPVGYVWQPAAWENVNGAWMFYDGHWRPAEQPEANVVYQPPPPPVQPEIAEQAPPDVIDEVRPPLPFEGAVWIRGNWHWDGGRWEWTGGRWSPRPSGYRWEEHRWEHRDDGRWERRSGHWHPEHEVREERREREEHR